MVTPTPTSLKNSLRQRITEYLAARFKKELCGTSMTMYGRFEKQSYENDSCIDVVFTPFNATFTVWQDHMILRVETPELWQLVWTEMWTPEGITEVVVRLDNINPCHCHTLIAVAHQNSFYPPPPPPPTAILSHTLSSSVPSYPSATSMLHSQGTYCPPTSQPSVPVQLNLSTAQMIPPCYSVPQQQVHPQQKLLLSQTISDSQQILFQSQSQPLQQSVHPQQTSALQHTQISQVSVQSSQESQSPAISEPIQSIPRIPRVVESKFSRIKTKQDSLRLNKATVPEQPIIVERRQDLCPLTGKPIVHRTTAYFKDFETSAFQEFIAEYHLNPGNMKRSLLKDIPPPKIQRSLPNEVLQVKLGPKRTSRCFFLPEKCLVWKSHDEFYHNIVVIHKDAAGHECSPHTLQLLVQRRIDNGVEIIPSERSIYVLHVQKKPSTPLLNWMPEHFLNQLDLPSVNTTTFSYRIIACSTISEGRTVFKRECESIGYSTWNKILTDTKYAKVSEDDTEAEERYELEEMERWREYELSHPDTIIPFLQQLASPSQDQGKGNHLNILTGMVRHNRLQNVLFPYHGPQPQQPVAPPRPDRTDPEPRAVVEATSVLALIKRRIGLDQMGGEMQTLCDRFNKLIAGDENAPELTRANVASSVNAKVRQLVKFVIGFSNLDGQNPQPQLDLKSASLLLLRVLNTQITVVDRQHPDFNSLMNSIGMNTGRNVTIFELNRPDDDFRMRKCAKVTDHRLLFHGSAVGNWLSILSGGLQPHGLDKFVSADQDQPHYGIFFADRLEKAMQYIGLHGYGGLQNGSVVSMCEVALGPPSGHKHKYCHEFRDYRSTPPFTEFHGMQRPVACPFGGVRHNEYIVLAPEQVRVRYLLHFS